MYGMGLGAAAAGELEGGGGWRGRGDVPEGGQLLQPLLEVGEVDLHLAAAHIGELAAAGEPLRAGPHGRTFLMRE